MAIYIGQPPEDRFARVPNDWLRDPKIRGLAKAVLAYFLSHRSGYALTVKQMTAEFKESEDALYAAIKELIGAGYVKREQQRGRKGVVGQVDYLVIGSDGAFPQVATASGFSGSGEPGSGPTCDDAEFPQVAAASGLSASGSAGSGKSGTKKNRAKKTTDLEEKDNTTSPFPLDDSAEAVEGEIVEEGEEFPSDLEKQVQELAEDHADLVAKLIDPHYDELSPGERARLGRALAAALDNGWTDTDLERELSADTAGLASVAAGLIGRIRNLGTPPEDRGPRSKRTADTTNGPARTCIRCDGYGSDWAGGYFTCNPCLACHGSGEAADSGDRKCPQHKHEPIACRTCRSDRLTDPGYIEQVNHQRGYAGRTPTSLSDRKRSPDRWQQPADDSEYDKPFTMRGAPVSPADQRVAAGAALYDKYKRLEESA